jgi:hypothetical protein
MAEFALLGDEGEGDHAVEGGALIADFGLRIADLKNETLLPSSIRNPHSEIRNPMVCSAPLNIS